MSIKNEAKLKNPLLVAIREQLEHRALWMYLLCDEARKKGLARKSMRRQQSSVVVFIREQIYVQKRVEVQV